MRNFNSPNHGSNLQHIKHQAKTNLIKSVVGLTVWRADKASRRRSNCKLGNTKSKCSRHILTTCISVVLNNLHYFCVCPLQFWHEQRRVHRFRGVEANDGEAWIATDALSSQSHDSWSRRRWR